MTFPSPCARAATRFARIDDTAWRRSIAGFTVPGPSWIKGESVHRRRRRRLPVAVRREPVRLHGVLPTTQAYASRPQPGEPRPLPPLEDFVEKGHVLGLNFPVALNPALARGLGVMLKLDFQRAVLNRIPKISARFRARLARHPVRR